MDDLTFSARRAGAVATARLADPADVDARFRTLVQSPLRAGILRYLASRPGESFDVERSFTSASSVCARSRSPEYHQ